MEMRGKENILRKATVLAFVLILVSNNAVATEVKTSQNLIGKWTIDVEASLADIAHHKKWVDSSESEKRRIESVIKRRAETMSLSFSADSMIMEHRGSKLVFPCRTRYDNGKLTVLSCNHGETPLTISVFFLDQNKLKFFSSGTDDTDIHVWRRN